VAVATAILSGAQIAERLDASMVVDVSAGAVELRPERLLDACCFLRDDRATDARFLNSLNGVDRYDYFEVIYNVSSLAHNHAFTLKVRADHEQPEVPSVTSIWHGAHLQEREIYDLFGIRFSGHPDLKRLFLWDGFPGHPLRKDFMSLPGGEHPGLQRFPKEDPRAWGGEFRGN
jgi:NADH-quinone oxidoreductase subunit C